MGEVQDVLIASNPAEAEAADRVRSHQAAIAGHVEQLVRVLAEATSGEQARDARDELAGWSRTELLPYVAAEGRALLAPAREVPEARLLAEAMLSEESTIAALVGGLEQATRPGIAVAAAAALDITLDQRRRQLDVQLLPALTAAPGFSVAERAADLAEPSGTTAPASGGGCCGGACGCS